MNIIGLSLYTLVPAVKSQPLAVAANNLNHFSSKISNFIILYS